MDLTFSWGGFKVSVQTPTPGDPAAGPGTKVPAATDIAGFISTVLSAAQTMPGMQPNMAAGTTTAKK